MNKLEENILMMPIVAISYVVFVVCHIIIAQVLGLKKERKTIKNGIYLTLMNHTFACVQVNLHYCLCNIYDDNFLSALVSIVASWFLSLYILSVITKGKFDTASHNKLMLIMCILSVSTGNIGFLVCILILEIKLVSLYRNITRRKYIVMALRSLIQSAEALFVYIIYAILEIYKLENSLLLNAGRMIISILVFPIVNDILENKILKKIGLDPAKLIVER